MPFQRPFDWLKGLSWVEGLTAPGQSRRAVLSLLAKGLLADRHLVRQRGGRGGKQGGRQGFSQLSIEDANCMQQSLHISDDYPKDVILKDGAGVTLRPLQRGDQDLVNGMLKRFPYEDLWFLGDVLAALEKVESLVQEMESGRAFSICAVLEKRIIAVAILTARQPDAEGHIGDVCISVDPDFREKRLGTWMLLELINVALSMGLEILVMRLIGGRDASVIRSAGKLEFHEEAVLRNYVKDRAGNPCDLVMMVKRLHRLWDDIEAASRRSEKGIT